MGTWHWIDYVIVGLISLSVITGLFRGFVKELVALSIWVIAIWLALHCSQTVSTWLESYIADKTIRIVAAFIAILVVTVILGGLLNTLLSFILQRSGLSGTDRILGMGFGLVRGVFIVTLLMLVLKMTSLPYQDYQRQSVLYAQFNPLVDWLYGFTPDFIKQMKLLERSSLDKTSATDTLVKR